MLQTGYLGIRVTLCLGAVLFNERRCMLVTIWVTVV